MTVFGSSNWTSASATSQQEHNYFTSKSWILTWFHDQFERMWNNSNPANAAETVPFVPLPPNRPTNEVPANAATIDTTTTVLKWYPGPWGALYDVYFGPSSTPPLVSSNVNLGPSTSTTDWKSWTTPALAAGTRYYWRIVSRTMAGLTAAGPVWSFTVPGTGGGGTTLPSGWADADIGSVGLAGGASYSAGVFDVSGSRTDIWNTASWAKAGVMIRETLDAASPYGFMLVSAAKGTTFQYRSSRGASAAGTVPISQTAPVWVKVVRSGQLISGFTSSDGAAWTLAGQATMAMNASAYIGLAVTSHNNAALCAATLDHVQ